VRLVACPSKPTIVRIVRIVRSQPLHEPRLNLVAQAVLSRGAVPGDGVLDYAEVATAVADEETTEYLKELGMKDAMALMQRLDGDGSGNVDAKSRRDFIRGLVPTLKDEVYRLRATGEYVASGFLRTRREAFIEDLKLDHKNEVVSLQKMFEKNYEKVELEEETYFKKRVSGIYSALVEHWNAQERYLEGVVQKKIALFMSKKDTTRNPTDPLTPKYTNETFELQALLRNLSAARHPTAFQLREGERHKIRLHELEDEAIARHATHQPLWFKSQAAQLKKNIQLMRSKFAQCKRESFDQYEKHVSQAREMLSRRHAVYDQRIKHAHRVAIQEKVLEDLRPVRALKMQPEIHSYGPTMQHLNKGGGNLDRVANGLGGYHLRNLERTGGAPQHVLRASSSGPPVTVRVGEKKKKRPETMFY